MKKNLAQLLYAFSQKKGIHKISVEQEDPIKIISHNRKAAINLCVLLSLLIVSMWFLIHFAIFLVNDVILFQKNVSVNETGAFVQSKVCESEQAMYLFTTSELWANTGIQLNKGDKIKLSVSGALNTSINSLYEGALKNKRPQYSWIMVGQNNDTVKSLWTDNNLTIYPVSHFGAILYQIRNDAVPCKSDWSGFIHTPLDSASLHRKEFRAAWADSIKNKMGIHELKAMNDYVDVEDNGTLYLAVNDIYLNDVVIADYERKNIEILNKINANDSLKDFIRQDSLNTLVNAKFKNLFKPFYLPANDKLAGDSMIYIAGQNFTEYFKENRDAWYKDNIGQIIVMADIQHNISDWPVKQVSWYRHIESLVLNIPEKPWNIAILLLEFLVVIPIVFFVVYALMTTLIYFILKGVLWSWDKISGYYIRLSDKALDKLQ